MQLHRLKLVNFRLHADSEIIFGPGMTAVVGPNGSGKTTLLEAIAWAFYSTPATRGSRDSIRRLGAPARAPVKVEVDFSLGAHDYRVARTLYGAELYQDSAAGAIANSQQAVTAKLTRLLGMNREEFFNTYFTGQKELTVMAAMGSTERAKFLSRLLGYERLRLAQEALRSERSRLRGEVRGLEQGLEPPSAIEHDLNLAESDTRSITERLETEEKAQEATKLLVKELEPQWRELEQLREANVSLVSERAIVEQQISEAQREFQRLDRDLALALQAKDQLTKLTPELAKAAKLHEEAQVLEQAGRAADRRRVLTGQLDEVLTQIRRLDGDVQGGENPEAGLAEMRRALDSTHAALKTATASEEELRTNWVRDVENAKAKRSGLRDQYRELQKDRDELQQAGPDGECPTCSRALGDEFDSVLETLERQVEEVESNGKFYRQRVKQLKREPADLQEARDRRAELQVQLETATSVVTQAESLARERAIKLRDHARLTHRSTEMQRELDALTDEYDPKRHDAIRDELQGYDPMIKQATELRVRAERAEQLGSEAAAAEQVLSAREARFGELERAITESGYQQETYEEVKATFERESQRMRNGELRVESIRGDLKAARAALESVTKRRDERQKRIKTLEKLRVHLVLHDELDGALEGLRGELNASLRPDLSELASTFMSDLTDGRYNEIELDEQYRLSVVEDGIPKPVISGGEEDITNLALRLAISQMVADRAGQPLSLLVLDEIFGGLDENRRENVVNLLRALADRFPQVILITHIESVKHGVDRVLRVSVDPKAQTATVAEDEGVVAQEHAAA